ncbi:hypothetical protein OC845_006747 [Tilletia horrida]|nr:hypothetical protein OC845_006747 [Tilletia horrida]
MVHSTRHGIEGLAVWEALRVRYGGFDRASMQAAELKLAAFTYRGGPVIDAIRSLESLFNQIALSVGESVSQARQVGILLRVFTNTHFDNIRSNVQESWDMGRELNFSDVARRFLSEEQARPPPPISTETNATSGPQALSAQHGQAQGHNKKGQRPNIKCWHCNSVGHRHTECNQRKAGRAPHPKSHFAREQNGLTPSGSGTTNITSRIDSVERFMANQASALQAIQASLQQHRHTAAPANAVTLPPSRPL